LKTKREKNNGHHVLLGCYRFLTVRVPHCRARCGDVSGELKKPRYSNKAIMIKRSIRIHHFYSRQIL